MIAENLKRGAALRSSDMRAVGHTRLRHHHVTGLEDALTHVQRALHDNLKPMAVVGVPRQGPVGSHTQRHHSGRVVLPVTE